MSYVLTWLPIFIFFNLFLFDNIKVKDTFIRETEFELKL